MGCDGMGWGGAVSRPPPPSRRPSGLAVAAEAARCRRRGARAAPAGRRLAVGVGWRDGCRRVLPPRSLPGRSGGRRCVPALPAESPGMWDGRVAVSRAYRAGTLRAGAVLRVTLAALQVSFIASLGPVRREGAAWDQSLWNCPGHAVAELSDGRLQVQLSKRVIQSTEVERLGLLAVCSAGRMLFEAGILNLTFLEIICKNPYVKITSSASHSSRLVVECREGCCSKASFYLNPGHAVE